MSQSRFSLMFGSFSYLLCRYTQVLWMIAARTPRTLHRRVQKAKTDLPRERESPLLLEKWTPCPQANCANSGQSGYADSRAILLVWYALVTHLPGYCQTPHHVENKTSHDFTYRTLQVCSRYQPMLPHDTDLCPSDWKRGTKENALLGQFSQAYSPAARSYLA